MDFTNFRFGVNTNSLVDTFTVNGTANVSGITRVFGNLVAASGVQAVDVNTGAFNVIGGAGITGNLYVGNIIANNFSGNISFTGDPIVGNIGVTYAGAFGSLNTANAVISGGYISGLANATITTGNAGAWYASSINATDGNITTLVVDNFSTANAVISGGYISSLSNAYITTADISNFSTANAVISGGYISNLTNATITTGNTVSWYSSELNASNANIATAFLSNLSTSNVLITGGYVEGLANISANTAFFSNLSTGNVLINGGVLSNINLQANNFSTANALVTGGEISNVSAQINNFSTANALVTGGEIYNVNLQANNFSTANALVIGGVLYNVDIQANNFSTANALITGGELSNVNAQINNLSSGNILLLGGLISNVDIQANNFSTSNILISGGVVYNTNIQANNFSTANALVIGGVIYNVDIQANNFSTANALVTGGNISNVDAQINNFSTANALIIGGVLTNINVQANNFSTANAVITGGYISSLSNITVTAANIGNVSISSNSVASTTGNLILSPLLSNSNAVVVINGTSALQLPAGTTGQQPAAYAGAIRWNTSTNNIEYYTGSSWISFLSQINNQTISPDGLTAAYTLDYSTTAEGVIVSINGTLQAPGTAYTVAGTTITFAEIPLVTDIISIRFIASGTVTAENAQEINAANLTLTTGAVLIDSFNTGVYRSAKYLSSSTSSTGSEFAEFAVTHFGSTVAVSNVNRAVTGTALATITANISGSLVSVYATSSSPAEMRLQKTYFVI